MKFALRNITTSALNFLPMKATIALLFALALCGCGGSNFLNPPPVKAASKVFEGRYLVVLELHTVGSAQPFVEGGILTAKDGQFSLVGTFNENQTLPVAAAVESPNVNISGSYTFGPDGYGTITASTSTDAFRGTEHFYCLADASYCAIQSAERGRSWRGKMWRDDSAQLSTSVNTVAGRYIFESDASVNDFSEAGFLIVDSPGVYHLQSTFNIPGNDGSGLTDPIINGCGIVAFGASGYGHFHQGVCPSTTNGDTFETYCFYDGSHCVLVPDVNELGGWIAEMRQQ